MQSETPKASTCSTAPNGRWWPALLAAAATVICAVVNLVQQREIRRLETARQAVPEPVPVQQLPPAASEEPNRAGDPARPPLSEPAEIGRLTARADELTAEVSRLEKIAAENVQLRQQLAAAGGTALTPEEIQTIEAARERAIAIRCVNNLKQLGLAARTFAIDNGNLTPASILQMTNEMNSPRILYCPADTAREAAADLFNWSSFTLANCSYEYLAPSAPETEPSRVMFRCPIHGNLGLLDGSVQMGVTKIHPEWLIQQDGKLYCYPSNR